MSNDQFEEQWLADLPPGWPQMRADFLCEPVRTTVDPECFGDDLVAHYSIPQVQETGGPAIEPASDIASLKLLITEPTLLVSKLNPRKSTICIAHPDPGRPTLASSEFIAISSDSFDQKYAYYLWSSEKVKDRLSALTQSATRSHQRVNPSDITKLPWKWPPIEVQQRIAHFLDEKTARIDVLIEKKQALLERLAEKCQALITRAVTKGLNPDVPMKPSGVDWLGEMPAHWNIAPLRWYLRTASGEAIRSEEVEMDRSEEAIPVVGGNGLMGFTASGANSHDSSLVIGRVGAQCGNVHLVSEPCWITDNALKVYRVSGYQVSYLLHALRVRDLNTLASRNAQPLMTGEVVRSQCMPMPSIQEQQEIERFIHNKLSVIEEEAALVEQSGEKLKEYRSALVTAAVTGQLVELNG